MKYLNLFLNFNLRTSNTNFKFYKFKNGHYSVFSCETKEKCCGGNY